MALSPLPSAQAEADAETRRGARRLPTTVVEAAAEPARLTGRPPLFPLWLRLDGQPCLVVGAGPVAARKAASLLESGAAVTVVAPRVSPEMEGLPVTLLRRQYIAGEAGAYRLVVAATGVAAVDTAVSGDADKGGALVNAVDDPPNCSFFWPASLRSGHVSVAVSTGGLSPFVAGWVRRRVESVVGPEVGTLAELVGKARAAVRTAGRSSEGLDWGGLVDGALWPLVTAGKLEAAGAAADAWVAGVLSSK